LPLIRGGQFRALAKLNDRPLTPLPDVPTLAAASGFSELTDMSSWIGFVAPAGTPQSIVEKIHRDIVKAYADAAVADRLDKAGINPVTLPPAEFDAFFRAEAVRWTKAYKEIGIKLE